MLTIKVLKEQTPDVLRRLKKKGFNDGEKLITQILEEDKIRRESQQTQDRVSEEVNKLSKEVGLLMKSGRKAEADEIRQRVALLKEEVNLLEGQRKTAEEKLSTLLVQLPNLPHDSVPEGRQAEDNVTEKIWGAIPSLPEDALPHWELAQKYNLIDFELGVKITGAGFPVYKGKGSRLQRALVQFFLDRAVEAGYEEVQPPYVVNAASGYGTGQLPDKEGQMYYIPEDGLYLIPTAEVPVTNIYRDVILEETNLPLRNVAYSACFRREAGSYGKDVRGLNRLHQFDKVEIVRIDTPEHSYVSLEEMCTYVESLLTALELPWRKLRLCGGDMSFISALTFDYEVFSAAQKRWLEVSSVSNFESFQANRLHCRYRDKKRNISLCHTLNGSALALPRIVAALLENNQTEKGIRIPEAIRVYTRFDSIC
ncbi:MAG: serine--tRNA ligase [Tannerellaceae bacterium]|jgi:seryl-tRNA synthetase|nr:serine--tRNA ligase [Tannerellaceae bacterium]